MTAAEAQLTTTLASTSAVRERSRAEVAELLGRLDGSAYAARLSARGLLALLGTRAIELAPEAVDPALRTAVERQVAVTRLHSLLLESTLERVVGALEARGVRVLPLKGTTLAKRLYGDVGLRPSADVDLLVAREQVGAAVEAVTALGYPAPDDPAWTDGLPLIHYEMDGNGRDRPSVELHWRVHWSERAFSEALLRSATTAPDGMLRPEPAHELALLILILARDGLAAPRLAADAATWWDRLGDQLAPGALDAIAAEHPSLRRSLVAGLTCIEGLGVPRPSLLTDAEPDRSTRLALTVADPLRLDDDASVFAARMLVDALLSTGRDKLGFLQRYVAPPPAQLRISAGLRGASRAAVARHATLHAVANVVNGIPRMIRELRRARRSPIRSVAAPRRDH